MTHNDPSKAETFEAETISSSTSNSTSASSRTPFQMPVFHEGVVTDACWFFAEMVDTLPVNIVCKDLHGRFIYVNEAFANFAGRRPEEFIGKTDAAFSPPEMAEKYFRDDQAVIQSGVPYAEVEQFLLPDGRRFFFDVHKTPLLNGNQQTIGVKAVFWDVTAEKQAKSDAEYERFLLDSLMKYLPDSIYFKDTESRFVRTSEGQAIKFGLSSPDQVCGKTDADIFSAEHAVEARKDELEIMRSGKPILSKVERETWPDGPDTWCSTTKMPWLDADGNVVGTFGISRDVTDLVLTEEALRKAKIAADLANKSKSDFLANMSHEIRTPMNAVIGITELLLDTKLTRAQEEYLKMVLSSGEALLSLINDILDFSKIEAGKLELDPVTFDPRDSFGDTARVLALRAHAKNLEMNFHVDPNVPKLLIGDLGRLRQIIVNLIGNAIKFTSEGEVVLKIELADDQFENPFGNTPFQNWQDDSSGVKSAKFSQPQKIMLKFSVSDTGIGIASDKLDLIFREFEQADTSTTREFGGTGLGLAIAARLIDLMKGRIWVESQLGVGSQFYFTAELEIAPADSSNFMKSPVIIQQRQALIVDDNATNRIILRDMLANWGMIPLVASSATEALEIMRQATCQGRPIPLILTDLNMPAIDGFQFVRSLRRDSELADVAVIMLTSGTRDGDLQTARELGIACRLTKPAKQSEVFDAIIDVLGYPDHDRTDDQRNASQTTHGDGETNPSDADLKKPLNVLLVEDNLVNQKLAIGVLSKGSHVITLANNGREAVAHFQKGKFDLILMDVQMPVMDGFEATAQIRELEVPKGIHTPILAMTARAMETDREECLAAGMDDYLSKPIRILDLMEKLDLLTNRSPLPASDSSASNLPASDLPTNELPADSTSAGAVIDWEFARASVNGDEELLRTLVAIVIKETPQWIAEIESSVNDGDAALLQLHAHTLKGSLRFLGRLAFTETAEGLEMMGQAGSLQNAPSQIPLLHQQWAQLATTLKTQFP